MNRMPTYKGKSKQRLVTKIKIHTSAGDIMSPMRKRIIIFSIIATGLLCLAGLVIYNLPPVNQRLSWRVESLQARIRRAINPPEEIVFIPQGQGAVETIAKATLDALQPTRTPSPQIDQTDTPTAPATKMPSATVSPTAVPSPTWTPIPTQVQLSGIVHQYQQFNNCGPANLAMALSFWGWQGDQRHTRAFLRPNLEVDDKNVNPSEMVAFVNSQTELRALTRVAGEQELLKRLIAAGFPVIIEEGHDPPDDWWMGHYLVVNGFDDQRQRFTAQDSLIAPDLPLPYEELKSSWWRDFNYVYVLIYPPERENQILEIIGPHQDKTFNYQFAAQRARQEIDILSGRDLFFAWFNLGSSLVGLEDYTGAAQAYDQAFELYATLPEDLRPYRLMWYQAGPYAAYYHTGRYQDVVNLANTTFTWVGKGGLEESHYWRGMAYEALGNTNQAITDLEKAVAINPNFTPAREALERLSQ
jgi:tetratricopeptide (TPR) repeat protein